MPAAAALSAVQNFWRFVDHTADKDAAFGTVMASAHGIVASGAASRLVRSSRTLRSARNGSAGAHSAPAATRSWQRSRNGEDADDGSDERSPSASLVHHLEARRTSLRRSASASRVSVTAHVAASESQGASPFAVAGTPTLAPAARSQREAFRARYPPASANNRWLQRLGPALIGTYGLRGREKVSPSPPVATTAGMTQHADSRDGRRPDTPLATALETAKIPTPRSLLRHRFSSRLTQTTSQTGLPARDAHAGSQWSPEEVAPVLHGSVGDEGPGDALADPGDGFSSASAQQGLDVAEDTTQVALAPPPKRAPPRLQRPPEVHGSQQLHEQVR